jgi:hypothetical protein
MVYHPLCDGIGIFGELPMKNFTTALRLLALGTLAAHAQAQIIGGITATPQVVKVGEAVTVTATVDVGTSNYCGFIVFYGDGASAESFSDFSKPSPFVTTHTYTKAGEYTLSMGGRHVQSRPNCGGPDKFATVKVEGASVPSPAPAAKPTVSKSFNAKTGAFACSAKPGTPAPEVKTVCAGELTYYENLKKGQLGCRP